MKVGDLVIRKISGMNLSRLEAITERNFLGFGIVLSKQMGGRDPVHPCITVYYPGSRKIYVIAESLMEVINESR